MTEVDPNGPAMTAARRFAREWSGHRALGNASEAIRGYYADGRPLEQVITYDDPAPLLGARAIVAAIDAESEPGTEARAKLVEAVVRELDPFVDV